jgi:hypothetical protein
VKWGPLAAGETSGGFILSFPRTLPRQTAVYDRSAAEHQRPKYWYFGLLQLFEAEKRLGAASLPQMIRPALLGGVGELQPAVAVPALRAAQPPLLPSFDRG